MLGAGESPSAAPSETAAPSAVASAALATADASAPAASRKFRIPKKKAAATPTTASDEQIAPEAGEHPVVPVETRDIIRAAATAALGGANRALLPSPPREAPPRQPPPRQPPPPPPKRLPDGWLESDFGGPNVCGLCPAKTPLSHAFDGSLRPEQRWSPATCIEACGGSAVRLVIDLTATDRYYSPSELPSGVAHVKILTQGRGVLSEEQVRTALDALKRCLDLPPVPGPAAALVAVAEAPVATGEALAADETTEPATAAGELAATKGGEVATTEELAAVGDTPGAAAVGVAAARSARAVGGVAVIHCTHGLNRTGYVLVRALCELHGFSLTEALDAFAAVRPPGLWRSEYIAALHERYGGPAPVLPVAPRWAKGVPVAPELELRHRTGEEYGGRGGRQGAEPSGVFTGALEFTGSGATYYQDRRRQWPYRTDAHGAALLRDMMETAEPLISRLLGELERDQAGEQLRSEGEKIYAQKPNLGANGVTWSQENYAHLGLQIEYLRLKSIQRYTESCAAPPQTRRTHRITAARRLRRHRPPPSRSPSVPQLRRPRPPPRAHAATRRCSGRSTPGRSPSCATRSRRWAPSPFVWPP